MGIYEAKGESLYAGAPKRKRKEGLYLLFSQLVENFKPTQKRKEDVLRLITPCFKKEKV